VADQGKKYRRPDGSTYRQYAGPKSAQDVEVPEETKPTPAPKPSGKVTETKSGAVSQIEQGERKKAEDAQRAVENVETIEKVAPWLLNKPKSVPGGLGAAAARERLKRINAAAAGDALVDDEEKRKKKKKEEE
jgi:hypothetical protein